MIDGSEDNEDVARAIEELLLGHRAEALGLARRIAGCQADAEDALQAALIQVLRHIQGGGEMPRRPRAWFLTVVANEARMIVRSATRRHRRERQVGEETVRWQRGGGEIDSERIRSIVEELPTVLRQPLELSYRDGLSAAEIGLRLGVAERTVRYRLTRAREQLRERLGSVTVVALPVLLCLALGRAAAAEAGGAALVGGSAGGLSGGTWSLVGLSGALAAAGLVVGLALHDGAPGGAPAPATATPVVAAAVTSSAIAGRSVPAWMLQELRCRTGPLTLEQALAAIVEACPAAAGQIAWAEGSGDPWSAHPLQADGESVGEVLDGIATRSGLVCSLVGQHLLLHPSGATPDPRAALARALDDGDAARWRRLAGCEALEPAAWRRPWVACGSPVADLAGRWQAAWSGAAPGDRPVLALLAARAGLSEALPALLHEARTRQSAWYLQGQGAYLGLHCGAEADPARICWQAVVELADATTRQALLQELEGDFPSLQPALLAHGSRPDRHLVDRCRRLRRDGSPHLRLQVLELLARMGDPETLADLADLARRGQAGLALQLLAASPHPDALLALVALHDQPALRGSLRALLLDGDWPVADLLRLRRDPDLHDLLAPAAVRSGESAAVAWACDLLASGAADEATVTALARSRLPQAQEALLDAAGPQPELVLPVLARCRDRRALAVLLSAASASAAGERAAAARGLRWAPPEQAVILALDALVGDPDQTTARAAVASLVALAAPGSAELVLRRARQIHDGTLQRDLLIAWTVLAQAEDRDPLAVAEGLREEAAALGLDDLAANAREACRLLTGNP